MNGTENGNKLKFTNQGQARECSFKKLAIKGMFLLAGETLPAQWKC